ncbi:MAG: hypothetical protein JRF61_26340 [Deltaproteobacteria bacterium]|jgi:hypothetical protein|nr:hypothetical protein [Deltaproteobacteria bacterium]
MGEPLVAWLSRTFDWIATHEAILSGTAVAIAGVAITILIRASHLLRERRASGRAAPLAAPSPGPPRQAEPRGATAATQEIHYCTTHDDVRIAWSSVGPWAVSSRPTGRRRVTPRSSSVEICMASDRSLGVGGRAPDGHAAGART